MELEKDNTITIFTFTTFAVCFLWVCVFVCACAALQDKARDLNDTLSRRDGTPEKSLTQMNQEIQTMLAELRARQLGGKKNLAEEELGLGEERHTHRFEVVTVSNESMRRRGVQERRG